MQGCEEITLNRDDLAFTAWARGTGPCVMLLHGFPDLPQSWRHLMPALDAAGFRAIAITSRGYEQSSQPSNGSYQLTAMAEDVPCWLDQLGESSAHIIGHDWGAAIAFAAVANNPQRFTSLCMVAVPHPGQFARYAARSPRQIWMSRYIMLFQLRGIAERTLAKNECAYVDTLWRRWSPGWDYPAHLTRAVRDRFREPGVIKAALSYYRQAADTRSKAGKASWDLATRAVDIPTLAIHGTRDGCIHADTFRNAMSGNDFKAGLSLETFTESGHFPHLEQPELFNGKVVAWLKDSR